MTRLAQAAVIVSVIVTVGIIVACSRPGQGTGPDQGTGAAPTTGTCLLLPPSADTDHVFDKREGYQVQIQNNTDALEDITGWVVLYFDDSGSQTGSDREPGGGYVDHTAIINLNDELGAGQSLTATVEPDGLIPAGTTSCQIAQVNQS
jgi:hypothetical protein